MVNVSIHDLIEIAKRTKLNDSDMKELSDRLEESESKFEKQSRERKATTEFLNRTYQITSEGK